jgi:hypothetical protein
MLVPDAMTTCEPNLPRRKIPGFGRTAILLGVAEVTLVLAITHVACRGFKQFTELGRMESAARGNFSPGWTMMLAACVVIVLRRRAFADDGLALRTWVPEIRVSWSGWRGARHWRRRGGG